VRVWSPRGEQPCEPLLELAGHDGRVTCVSFCDDSVVTASTDKTVRRWRVVDGRQLFVCRGHQSVVTRLICTGDFIFSCERLHLSILLCGLWRLQGCGFDSHAVLTTSGTFICMHGCRAYHEQLQVSAVAN